MGDIDSFLPNDGKVIVRMKTSKNEVLVRIPEWAEPNQVSWTVNGEKISHPTSNLHNNYLNLGRVKAGDTVLIEFPIKEWAVYTQLPVSPKFSSNKKKQCLITLKGNTVIAINNDVGYPIHQAAEISFSANRNSECETLCFPGTVCLGLKYLQVPGDWARMIFSRGRLAH
jgi:hypothetical protein